MKTANTIPTTIVDKNGKKTTVHVNPHNYFANVGRTRGQVAPIVGANKSISDLLEERALLHLNINRNVEKMDKDTLVRKIEQRKRLDEAIEEQLSSLSRDDFDEPAELDIVIDSHFVDEGVTKPRWHDQDIVVVGQKRKLGEVSGGKLFHGSPTKIDVGGLISPQEERNFKQSSDSAISITSDVGMAAHWAREAAKPKDDENSVYIYEIEPTGEVEGWRIGLANQGKNITLMEGRTPSGKIIAVHEIGMSGEVKLEDAPANVRYGYSNLLSDIDEQRDKLIDDAIEVSRAWIDTCSSAEISALRDYTNSSDEYAIKSTSGKLSQKWIDFESAVDRAPRLKETFVSYTGVNSYYVNNILSQAENGEVDIDRVLSSSLNPAQVNGFATSDEYGRTLALEVETNKGAFMDIVSHSPHEMEVMLPKGKYEVIEVLEDVTYLWGREKGFGRTIDKVLRLRFVD